MLERKLSTRQACPYNACITEQLPGVLLQHQLKYVLHHLATKGGRQFVFGTYKHDKPGTLKEMFECSALDFPQFFAYRFRCIKQSAAGVHFGHGVWVRSVLLTTCQARTAVRAYMYEMFVEQCIFMCLYVCIYTYAHRCIYTRHTYTYNTSIYMYICIYLYVCVCVSVCVHVYMCVYTQGVDLSTSVSPGPVFRALALWALASSHQRLPRRPISNRFGDAGLELA